jgi:transcriptional regulator GlxA family with amidase domain
VAFLLLPDFTLSTFTGFVDALRLAADEADRSRQRYCRWTIIGPDRTAVRSSCGIEITPWELMGNSDEFHYTIVVGGLLSGHSRIDKRILDYLRKADQRGGALIGLCTGSFALARAGLMRHHRSCVHWFHLREFRQEFPNHRVAADRVYIVDGRRITCSGGQSAIDLAIHLVERHCGRGIALKVASYMVVSNTRGLTHPQPHPEMRCIREIKNSLVQRAILIMEQHLLVQPVVVRVIAAQLGVSTRTLARAFQQTFNVSPATFFRAMRIAHCRWELLNTQKSSGRVALDHGFADASHFTRVYRQFYGTSPTAAREHRAVRPKASDRRSGASRGRQGNTIDRILRGDSLSFSAVDW